MSWQFNGQTPLFAQISDMIRSDILSGKYPPDSRIPPVRQLAFDASVNPNTMQRALSVLEDEGLLYTKGTMGRFVTSDPGILSAAKNKMKASVMSRLLGDAANAGISKEELIEFINKEVTR